jgi:nicotinamidase-related amidase
MLIKKQNALLLVIDVQEKLLPAIANAEPLAARLRWLVGACHDLTLPIVFSEQYPRGLGHTIEPLRQQAPDAPTVEKLHFSCVRAGCLPAGLMARTQFVLCGMESHVCVLQTALELRELGKEVFVVADAIGSRQHSDHQYALGRMLAAGVEIVSREMVLFELLEEAGTEQFRMASKRYLQGEQP